MRGMAEDWHAFRFRGWPEAAPPPTLPLSSRSSRSHDDHPYFFSLTPAFSLFSIRFSISSLLHSTSSCCLFYLLPLDILCFAFLCQLASSSLPLTPSPSLSFSTLSTPHITPVDPFTFYDRCIYSHSSVICLSLVYPISSNGSESASQFRQNHPKNRYCSGE